MQIPITYDRRIGLGKQLDLAHTLNASDWRGLNRNQAQNAVLEVGGINENKTKVGDYVREETKLPVTPFKYVSLFSGIGGFEQALNRLGGTCVLASEIDKFANQAYEAIYGHPTAGDITKVDAADVPDHDILVGGFPCQAFSVAGKRGGFDDARGTLFFEMARLAAEKKPKLILAENVKGLVSHDKGKTLDTIVKTLNDIGYRVDFEIMNSKYFGVPQNRERIFIVGVREDLIENQPWVNVKGSTVIPKGKRRLAEYSDLKSFNFEWPSQDEVTTKLIDVLEHSVDEKYYLSDEKTATLLAKLVDQSKDVGDKDIIDPSAANQDGLRVFSGVSPTLRARDYKEPRMVGHVLPAEPPFCVHNIYGGFNEAKPRVFEDESPTIRTSAGGGHLPSVLEEVEGLPIKEATKTGYAVAEEGDAVNFRFPNSNTRRGRVGKQVANTLEASGISQGVVEREGCVNNRGTIETRETSNALDANYAKGIDNHGQRTQVLESRPSPRYRIRKLTPLETFRLQGFSDEVHQTVVDAGISDSQRYKQAGNAVTVNVIEALGQRMLPLLNRQ